MKHIDRTVNPPTKESSYGAAWKLNIQAIRERFNCPPERDGSITSWIVLAPWAHPFWSYYFLFAIHLRPLAGMPDAKIGLLGATHEVMLYAMSPDFVPDLTDPTRSVLSPINFAAQWVEPGETNRERDAYAMKTIETCVDDILAMTLNPDTDFRQQWVARFSDSNYRNPAP